ncbi:MAG: glycosyltransferase [Anaerolineae bacterium]
MRIGLFADCYEPTISGVVTSLLQLRRGLERLGHEIVLLVPETPGYREEDGAVYRFASLPFNRASGFRFGLVAPRAVQHIVRREKLDIIHTHTEYSLGWAGKCSAQRLGLPFLHTAHTLHQAYRHYLPLGKAVPARLVQSYLRLFLSGCDALVCPSEKAHNYFKAFVPGVKAVVIGNGVDPTDFRPQCRSQEQEALTRRALGLSPTDQVILYAGRIAPEKRVVELLEALSLLLQAHPRARLLFVGSGPADQDLAVAVERHGLSRQVILVGKVHWPQMHWFYSLAHVFVTASLSEMQPMTLIEATLCGLPIVARRDPAYTGLVRDDENGYLVASDRELAATAMDLLQDESRRQRLSENARLLSETFSAKRYAGQLERLYSQVAESKSGLMSPPPPPLPVD